MLVGIILICTKQMNLFKIGLTCTEQNFTTKAGAQRVAAEHGIFIVAPDTSPRKLNLGDIKYSKFCFWCHWSENSIVVTSLPLLDQGESGTDFSKL